METQRRSILPAVWDVPQIFRDRLGTSVGRQRVMQADGHLLLVLHAPPGIDDDSRSGRFFWRSPDGTWSSKDLGSGIQALKRHLDEYAEAIEKHDTAEERATTSDEYFGVIEAVAPLHRAAGHLHQVLQEARKLCPDDRDIIDARDQAYDIERNAELLYNGAKNGLDFAIARRAEEQARTSRHMAAASHRLNLLVALFFPIATLSAIFGVNLDPGWKLLQGAAPFFIMIGVGLICGIILTRFVTRDRNSDS